MQRWTSRALLGLSLLCLGCAAPRVCRAGEAPLAQQMAQLKVPPEWLEGQTVHYDMTKPWKEARLHVRKLLSEGKNREAVKISYVYHSEKRGSPDGHEYPMYLFLGGEHVWAAKVCAERHRTPRKGYVFETNALASIHVKFGEHAEAIKLLRSGFDPARLPDPPQRLMAMAGLHDALGDAYADKDDRAKATEHYQKAMEHYGKAKPRYGRHLLPRRVAKVQAKLDLLGREALDISKLRDGVYRGQSLGYGKPVHAAVTVKGGRITGIGLRHEEKIEQGATKSVPRQIIERQSLDVDAVTGATVTVQAIVEATYRALSRAGAK